MSRLLTYSIIMQQKKLVELLLHCKFNETSGLTAYDETANNYDGTLNNSPLWSLGMEGNSLFFNGVNQYVSWGDILDMGYNSFTFGCWIRTANADGLRGIIGKSLNAGELGRYSIYFYDNYINVILDFQDLYGYPIVSYSSSNVCDLNWHQVVARINRKGNLELFVDGQSVGTPYDLTGHERENINFQSIRSLMAGCYLNSAGSPANYYIGYIDYVFFYNGLLSNNQISGMYDELNPAIKNYELYLKLDETSGSTAYDEEGLHNGTLYNSPTWVSGINGNCLEFNGSNQYVMIPNIPPFGKTSFTFGCWIKTSNLSGLKGIFGKSVYGVVNGRWGFYTSDNFLYCLVTNNNSHRQVSIAVGDYDDNNWHLLVGRVDRGGYLKFYIDGNSVGTPVNISGDSAIVHTHIGNLLIGVYGNSTGTGPQASTYFTGLVDDCWIYKGLLSDDDITEIYNSFTA